MSNDDLPLLSRKELERIKRNNAHEASNIVRRSLTSDPNSAPVLTDDASCPAGETLYTREELRRISTENANGVKRMIDRSLSRNRS